MLITGASRGIGRAIAYKFAAQGANVLVGARTINGYQKVVDKINENGGLAAGVLLDVTKEEQINETVDHIIGSHGSIDVLINCAGVIVYDSPTWLTTVEEWDNMMEVNVKGTFLCCRSVIPHMIDGSGGCIINMGSSSARMADDEYGPYTATKWAVAGYTASLARSVRQYNIRVNGINPGWVDTDMARLFNPDGDPEWSTAEEIAEVALFLADSAPRDMTGQFIDIFGS